MITVANPTDRVAVKEALAATGAQVLSARIVSEGLLLEHG